MRLPSPTSLRITRPAAALALTAALGLGGVSLAASDTGGFAALRDALLGRPRAPSFAIKVAPSSQTVTAGQGTSYSISIFQRKYRAPVRLRVVSRLPAGVPALWPNRH